MKMFKKRRGIKISYPMQGLVCFTCLTYKIQPQTTRNKIDRMCDEIGREYRDALFEFLTTECTVVSVSMKHYVCETVLYDLRKKFYENWTKYE